MSDNSAESPLWLSKQIQLDAVDDKIPNGSAVYIGSCAATADATLGRMVASYRLENIQIIQMIPGGDLPHLSKGIDRFRTVSFYSFTKGGYFKLDGASEQEGLQDYKPISISAIPRLLDEGRLSVDVAIIKVSRPHKGFVSVGMGVDLTFDFVRHARVVIAEVNEAMPWTEGPSKLPLNAIDWWISNNEPLKTTEQLWPQLFDNEARRYPQDVLQRLGQNVVREVRDRDTLRFSVSPLVYCTFPFLNERKDLGLHTDVLTEDLFRLHLNGVITNKYKTLHPGRSVVSQAHGSEDLYDFLDRNPVIEVHPSSFVCDPLVLGKIDNLVSIVGALKVDVTGQVATDSIAHKFYGGVWSDDDAVRGAQYSKGGRPIIMLPSVSLAGRSNVVFALPPGTGVSITRADVEYVVTEFGTAYLHGKSIRERCLAMIDIAHPDFRQELLAQAKEHNYISKSQPGKSFGTNYPAQFECVHTSRKQKRVLVRPIKAVDEDQLRNFFHKLSDHSVYLRYFRKMRSMPQRILQRTVDVDYSSDMAIVALSPPDAFQHEIVGIAQWVSDPRIETGTNIPEIAFQVRDDWQGEGLGSFLFQKLLEIARAQDIGKLKADVLAGNSSMNAIFQRSGVAYTKRTDFGVITYFFDLSVKSDTT
jgi:acyl-CoA hydrolase/GNAT superfamily N-acetyltransferase